MPIVVVETITLAISRIEMVHNRRYFAVILCRELGLHEPVLQWNS